MAIRTIPGNTSIMKLILKNFRVFEDREFAFEKNYALISGASGAGKSTLFMAMHFAVTGEGKKLTTYGKKSCSVRFVVDDRLDITRTKGPCRLLVTCDDARYEDAEAQAIVDSRLPNWELGYVSQKLYRSFVAMTPAEKLSYINGFAFGEMGLEDAYKKCRTMISERKEDLMATITERETTEKLLNSMNVKREFDPNDEVDEDALSRTEADLSSKLKRARIELREIERIDDLRARLNAELASIESNRDDDADLTFIARQTENWNSYEKQVEKLKELERKLSKAARSEFTPEELKTMANEIKTISDLTRETEKLPEFRATLERLEEFKIRHAVKLSCPICSGKLGLWCNSLIPDDGSLINVTAREAEEFECKRISLANEVAAMELRSDLLEAARAAYPVLTGTSVAAYSNELAKIARADGEYDAIAKCRAEQESRVERCRCDKPERSLKEVEKMIATRATRKRIERQLAELPPVNRTEEDARRAASDIEERLVSIGELKKASTAKKYWTVVENLKKAEREKDVKLPRAVKLQSLIKTAEKLALQETIDAINFRAQIYLDKFFDDVRMELTFDGRINTTVTHNGYPADLSSFSGGELARAALAFTIALCELNDVKVLLLDECFASLDSDTTDVVMNVITENFDGQIVCVAHQTTKGCFNEIIEV